jgi:type II secretory pathway component PulC
MNMGSRTMNARQRLERLGLWLGLVATLVLTVSAALAEDRPPEAAERSRQGTEAQLEEAQARLEAAAREIADLTARIVGDAGMDALTRIEEFARRSRPVMLGITVGPVGEPEAREPGVRVLGVTPGSSAEAAGINSGDVLVALGDQRLDWSGDSSPLNKLLDGLRELEPGAVVEVAYLRDGDEATVSVEARPWSWARAFAFNGERPRIELPPMGALPQPGMRRLAAERWGDMELVTLSPELGEYFQASAGVLVVKAPSDPLLGLRDGDVIVDIAGRKPTDPGHVVRILRSYAPGERLVMTVVRRGVRQTLEADIPG